MKLYRNADGHFTATQEQAKAAKREGRGAFEQVEVPTSEGREALADYLNSLVAHANDGLAARALAAEPPEQIEAKEAQLEGQSYTPAPQPAFAPPVRPAPRLHPSVPTVDLMVDLIDRGDIDARGLSNLAESVAHRFQQLARGATMEKAWEEHEQSIA